jgi:hypothetical protein
MSSNTDPIKIPGLIPVNVTLLGLKTSPFVFAALVVIIGNDDEESALVF